MPWARTAILSSGPAVLKELASSVPAPSDGIFFLNPLLQPALGYLQCLGTHYLLIRPSLVSSLLEGSAVRSLLSCTSSCILTSQILPLRPPLLGTEPAPHPTPPPAQGSVTNSGHQGEFHPAPWMPCRGFPFLCTRPSSFWGIEGKTF